MGYQNLQFASDEQWSATIVVPAAGNHKPAFGKTEWDVIGMARVDGPRSANPNGLVNRLLRKLFAVSIPRPLANERLEGLRRFAVAAWYRQEIRTRDMRAFFDVGFSSNDAARVLAHVSNARGVEPEVEAWP
jgi:hypothetical protein